MRQPQHEPGLCVLQHHPEAEHHLAGESALAMTVLTFVHESCEAFNVADQAAAKPQVFWGGVPGRSGLSVWRRALLVTLVLVELSSR